MLPADARQQYLSGRFSGTSNEMKYWKNKMLSKILDDSVNFLKNYVDFKFLLLFLILLFLGFETSALLG